jgi:hypothetical protein
MARPIEIDDVAAQLGTFGEPMPATANPAAADATATRFNVLTVIAST